MRKWVVNELDCNILNNIVEEYKLNDFVARVIASKNIDFKDIGLMIDDKLEFSDPFNIKDMDKAVARIYEAIDNEEEILVFGDYDADGVSSTALLYNYLKNMGAYVNYYIPQRERDGYGLTIFGIKKVIDSGINLIITVDNGITANGAVDFAKENNIDVVITDHHQPLGHIPNAVAVVNPHRNDCESEFKLLAGVGVVFKLICAMEDNDTEMILNEYSDLIAIGTISDMMPLIGENRSIVKQGLSKFSQSNNLGVIALCERLGLDTKSEVTEDDIGFKIAPIINSAGRVSKAEDALKLLICEDVEECNIIAENITALNEKRKNIEKDNMSKVVDYLKSNGHILNNRVLVIAIEGLHQGTIGILASRLCNKYLKPIFVLTDDKQTGLFKGSSRSIGDYNLHKALVYASSCIEFFGGHKLAAGLSIKRENLQKFSAFLDAFYKENIDGINDVSLTINSVIEINDISVLNIKSLDILSPFGKGNESPVFMFKSVKIVDIKSIGDKSHSQLKIIDKNNDITFINYFRMNKENLIFNIEDVVDVAFSVSINEFKGQKKTSLTIIDIKLHNLNDLMFNDEDKVFKIKLNEKLDENEIKDVIPTRDEIAQIYRLIKKHTNITNNLQKIYYKVGNGIIPYVKILVCLRALMQHDLIRAYRKGEHIYYKTNEETKKVDIMDCDIIKNLTSKGSVK